MGLSIFTNAASMTSINALNKAHNLQSIAMQRLSSGKRINSSADDAAGLQIATRLTGQTRGMAVAQRNIADATTMLQTAEGAFDELSNIMYRMKDLATQGANDTNTTLDRTAINSELTELQNEMNNIMATTSFAGEKLFGASGKLSKDISFQIGSSTEEVMVVKLGTDLTNVNKGVTDVGGKIKITDASSAHSLMTTLEQGLDAVGSIRSSLGANVNRLGHTSANLSNMKDNTELALGNIRDTDFAAETAIMTRNSMLSQTSITMLKQSNNMSGMVLSLLQ